ncbi:MAG TPA: Maf family nucleotide pyrophosphatase [Micropepsaceae bacterium]|nr:Maf family nucleotide pyrophosphatase [Micropepsaceae bacterium]
MRVDIVLASTSTSRRAILEAAGIAFTAIAPNVDEEQVRGLLEGEGAYPQTIAEALADAKAIAVSERYPEALVLGADQLLVCEDRIFAKARDEPEARETLRSLRAREHELIGAAAIAKEGAVVWRHTDHARLTMRDFSDVFLDDYIRAEMPDILSSVGCYRIEGRGAQLFSRVAGDHFSIRGLPLLPVLEAFRTAGALAS